MSLPQPVMALIHKYEGPNVPEMEEPYHDQQPNQAYVVAVLRDLDELDEYLGAPVYAALRHHLMQHVEMKVWFIQRRSLKYWFIDSYLGVAEALRHKEELDSKANRSR